jgi:hypothetical protein
MLGVTAAGQPVLAVLGAGSVLSVPLRAGEFTPGVLTLVRSPEKPAFSLSDPRVLEEIGEHIALALRSERRQRRRSDTAAALQASLLPQVPAPIPGLDWAAAYRPGSTAPKSAATSTTSSRAPAAGAWCSATYAARARKPPRSPRWSGTAAQPVG